MKWNFNTKETTKTQGLYKITHQIKTTLKKLTKDNLNSKILHIKLTICIQITLIISIQIITAFNNIQIKSSHLLKII